MTEEPTSDHAAEDIPPSGPIGAIRGLFVGVIEAVRTRLNLATVEAEIFLLRTIQMLLWAFAAVACGLLALAFAVVAVVAALWDSHRMLGVLGGAGLFLILMFTFGFIAKKTFTSKPHMLAGTLQQLETDQQRVGGQS